jgi:signal transduction histidine kinase
MIGVVVTDGPAPVNGTTLKELMHEVDEQSLRLDTALAFDEVRSIATVEERHRLAREIHDGIAQEVASLGYVVDDLAATATDPLHAERLRELRTQLTRMVGELRLSIFDLRSDVTSGAGLGSALSDYVHQVGARSAMTVHLTLDESPTRLRAGAETELLRIAQEAITNARKHSNAANLWVDCRVRPPFARVQIRDDGTGLGHGREDSYGLRIMHERAERIDADLRIEQHRHDSTNRGTQITVTLGVDPAFG